MSIIRSVAIAALAGSAGYAISRKTQSALPETSSVARDAFLILRAKSMLERQHWNGGRTPPLLNLEDLTIWYRLSALMLSTVGTYLENVSDIAERAMLEQGDETLLRDELIAEASRAASEFAKLTVHPTWITGDLPNVTDFSDEAIRRHWRTLCDVVAEVAGVSPSYGTDRQHDKLR